VARLLLRNLRLNVLYHCKKTLIHSSSVQYQNPSENIATQFHFFDQSHFPHSLSKQQGPSQSKP
jgi:hypothetical protein